MVALVTLDHATLVRIQARQPITSPTKAVKVPKALFFIAKSEACCSVPFRYNPSLPHPKCGENQMEDLAKWESSLRPQT